MTCPTCQGQLVDAHDGPDRGSYCVRCQRWTPYPGKQVAPAPSPAPRRSSADTRSEAVLVERIRVHFERLGYIVLRVGQYRADKGGSDAGVPDLLFARPEWGSRMLAVEVKLPGTGRLSERQQEFADMGIISVCRSVEEVDEAVKGVKDE